MVDIIGNLLPGTNLPVGANLGLPVSTGTGNTTVPVGTDANSAGAVTVNNGAGASGGGLSVGDTGVGVLLPGGGSGGLGDLSNLGGLLNVGGEGGAVPNLLSGLDLSSLDPSRIVTVGQNGDGTNVGVDLSGGGGGANVNVPNLLDGLTPKSNPATGAALPTVYDAYANVFRTWTAPAPEIKAQLDALKALVDAGQITQTQAILQIVHAAAPFSGVAAATYQFFTGHAPSADGLTYLVNSSANPTDLNDAYYQPFNTENRFINFASNLGLHGEGSAKFAADYGSLSFEEAVQKAYGDIVGFSADLNGGFSSGGAVADIVSRRDYFDRVATERFGADDHGLAVKLTAIGYILQEAVRGGVGLYGDSVENFLFDLADGQAQANVDLVGVYGPASLYNID